MDTLLTYTQAVAKARRTKDTLRRWIKIGWLTRIGHGRKTRFSQDELAGLLQRLPALLKEAAIKSGQSRCGKSGGRYFKEPPDYGLGAPGRNFGGFKMESDLSLRGSYDRHKRRCYL